MRREIGTSDPTKDGRSWFRGDNATPDASRKGTEVRTLDRPGGATGRASGETVIPPAHPRSTMNKAEDPMQPHEDDALLTPSEVAAMFRVNPKTVTRWARAGQDLGDPHPWRAPPFPGQRDSPVPRAGRGRRAPLSATAGRATRPVRSGENAHTARGHPGGVASRTLRRRAPGNGCRRRARARGVPWPGPASIR